MDRALKHAKSRAKVLSKCSITYIVHIALKELGISSAKDGFYYTKHAVMMLCENPTLKLTNGVYSAVGMLRDPFAGEDQVEQASSYFATSAAYLVQTGNSYEICCTVTATGLMDELGFSVIKVQRRLAGSDDEWETRKTFTKEDYPHLIDYDQVTHAASVTYGGLPAYEYRAYLELYAKNSNGKAYYGRYAY